MFAENCQLVSWQIESYVAKHISTIQYIVSTIIEIYRTDFRSLFTIRFKKQAI